MNYQSSNPSISKNIGWIAINMTHGSGKRSRVDLNSCHSNQEILAYEIMNTTLAVFIHGEHMKLMKHNFVFCCDRQ